MPPKTPSYKKNWKCGSWERMLWGGFLWETCTRIPSLYPHNENSLRVMSKGPHWLLPKAGNCGQCWSPAWNSRGQETDDELISWWIKGEQFLYWEGWHSLSLLGHGLIHVSWGPYVGHMGEKVSQEPFLDPIKEDYLEELWGHYIKSWYGVDHWKTKLSGGKADEVGKCTAHIIGVAGAQMSNLWRIHQRAHRKKNLIYAKPFHNYTNQVKTSLSKERLPTMTE